MTRLADLTTLRVGGAVRSLVQPATERELIDAVRASDAAHMPLLVLGGGSNILAADAPFDGLVVRDPRRSVSVQDDGMCGGVSVTVTAGTPWDDVVARAVDEGWVGIEALSGIPGSTGATPVQNVGAYGAEVADVIALVRVWDRLESRVRSLARVDCGFAYRDSLLKRSMRGAAPDAGVWSPSPRYVVLDVTFQMRQGTLSSPIRYAQLAAALDVAEGERAPLADVRAAVLAVRGSKGMVLDDADPDTWSAGSFFTNPILDEAVAATLPEDAPRFAAGEGRVKTSAAWLIEQAGFTRGFAVTEGAPATLSTKHTLALTNRGAASAADVLELARAVRDGVRERFAVELVPEPVLLGATL
ncbi:UDP-N-acetylmuramate dehydrogenase [Demequina activiva]|uniref:UDP-N-acetylenolpyruvoylglucosamine reductase n=1 Tax=Demequina activiva TaxID=1582364 RepID=A0A919Q5Y3_9MICO|nr:UDP-N-acetylmuramate dehydrogenase [Demequina activiva]GIG54858.1 UDP-N-acetylenolpyruvoylglucosamine reductase [Demequina activiva]